MCIYHIFPLKLFSRIFQVLIKLVKPMVKVKNTSKRVMPRTVNFHLFIRIKDILDVPHLRMDRVTFVQQNLTQKEICWSGLGATNFANKMLNVSFKI